MAGRVLSKELSRRDVLQGVAAGVGCAALGAWSTPAWASARATSDLSFVFALFRGGWDLGLSLDPGPADAMLGHSAQPLGRHARRLAIVRGLHMETLVHEVALNRFLTGRPPALLLPSGESFATQLARALGGRPPLVLGIEDAAGRSVDPMSGLPAHLQRSRALRRRLAGGDATARAEVVVEAITSGETRVASLEVASGLDTHGPDWESHHPRRLRAGFEIVAEILDELAERRAPGLTSASWLDRTILLGFSEFGRSPEPNDAGGRDHHVANACFLAGGPVAGGRVHGATSKPELTPQPVDLATGRPARDGELLRPEHVLASLARVACLGSAGGFKVPPLGSLFA